MGFKKKKIKNFSSVKNLLRKQKEAADCDKVIQSHMSDKGLVYIIHKEY